MGSRVRTLLVLVLLSLSTFTGCLGSEKDSVSGPRFPAFNQNSDTGQNISLADYKGSPFIVVFSAEWCTNPCQPSMHAINETLLAPPAIVISTDPADKPQGVSLSEWKQSADSYDDERDDNGTVTDPRQTLDYRFIKGADIASELDVQAPGTLMFIDADGFVIVTHIGILDDGATITSYWTEVGGITAA